MSALEARVDRHQLLARLKLHAGPERAAQARTPGASHTGDLADKPRSEAHADQPGETCLHRRRDDSVTAKDHLCAATGDAVDAEVDGSTAAELPAHNESVQGAAGENDRHAGRAGQDRADQADLREGKRGDQGAVDGGCGDSQEGGLRSQGQTAADHARDEQDNVCERCCPQKDGFRHRHWRIQEHWNADKQELDHLAIPEVAQLEHDRDRLPQQS